MIDINAESADLARLDRVLKALEAFPQKEFMDGLVDLTMDQALERIQTTKRDPDGDPWKPWSRSYRSHGAPFHAQHTLLHLSGDMMNSLSGATTRSTGEVTASVPYAGFVNEERQFLGFADNDPAFEDFAIGYLTREIEAA